MPATVILKWIVSDTLRRHSRHANKAREFICHGPNQPFVFLRGMGRRTERGPHPHSAIPEQSYLETRVFVHRAEQRFVLREIAHVGCKNLRPEMSLGKRSVDSQNASDRRRHVHAIDDIIRHETLLEVRTPPYAGVHVRVIVPVAVVNLAIEVDLVVANAFGPDHDGRVLREMRIVLDEVPDVSNGFIGRFGCFLVLEPARLIADVTAGSVARVVPDLLEGNPPGLKFLKYLREYVEGLSFLQERGTPNERVLPSLWIVFFRLSSKPAMKSAICFFSADVIPMSGNCLATMSAGDVLFPS